MLLERVSREKCRVRVKELLISQLKEIIVGEWSCNLKWSLFSAVSIDVKFKVNYRQVFFSMFIHQQKVLSRIFTVYIRRAVIS